MPANLKHQNLHLDFVAFLSGSKIGGFFENVIFERLESQFALIQNADILIIIIDLRHS